MIVFVAQGIISDLVGSLFQIEHDYFGTMLSNLAKVSGVRVGRDEEGRNEQKQVV